MKRGFKAQCERRSIEIRRQIGLGETECLIANDVATLYSTSVISADKIPGLSEKSANQLFNIDQENWAAFTLKKRNHSMIVYRPVSSHARVNSVTMHELSHIILGHTFASIQTSHEGHMIIDNYNQEQEDEADWLASTLLLPRPALLSVKQKRLADTVICQKYLVSLQMLQWRVRMTGIEHQIRHSQAKKNH